MSANGDDSFARLWSKTLRMLCAENARLLPSSDGFFALANGKVRSETRIPDAIVRQFRKRDWLRSVEGGAFVLSDAGEGVLARLEAPDDPFAAQHQTRSQQLLEEGGPSRVVTVDDAESPLAWLMARKRISRTQFDAGEKLRRDFTLGGLMPRMGVDYSAAILGRRRGYKPEANLSDTIVAARQRFSRAMREVGPELSDLLFDVCCHLKGLETVERRKGWPRRSAKIVLQLGLDRLAAHYGLSVTGPSSSPVRAWQAEELCHAE